jgi:hypothetical protein
VRACGGQVKCKVEFVNFDGRADEASLKQIIKRVRYTSTPPCDRAASSRARECRGRCLRALQVQPRKIAVVRGTAAARDALQRDFGGRDGGVLVPAVGERVDLSPTTNTCSVCATKRMHAASNTRAHA